MDITLAILIFFLLFFLSDLKKSHGIFNPVSTLALLLIVQFPLKYLYLTATDKGFTLEKFDGAISAGLVAIFSYFLVTFVTYAVLRINEPEKATVPVINVRNIDRLSYLSIITPILIFSLFIGLHGLNAVKNPIAIRAFWSLAEWLT